MAFAPPITPRTAISAITPEGIARGPRDDVTFVKSPLNSLTRRLGSSAVAVLQQLTRVPR